MLIFAFKTSFIGPDKLYCIILLVPPGPPPSIANLAFCFVSSPGRAVLTRITPPVEFLPNNVP